MADDKQAGLFSFTAAVPMYHPNLFEARAFGAKGKESGTPKFSANFAFQPDAADLASMKAIAVKIARAKWPDRALKDLQFPFSNGDKIAASAKAKGKDGSFNAGKVIIAARSKYEPGLAGVENGKVVDYEGAARVAAKGKFYFGVEVLAQVNFVAYDGVGKNPDGVTAYLNKVLTTGKGVKVAGGASAAEVFKGYVGTTTTEDPTGGVGSALDDEIPF